MSGKLIGDDKCIISGMTIDWQITFDSWKILIYR